VKKGIVIFLIAVFAIWIIARLTHALEIYKIPTTANEPTYKAGSIIIASKFKNPGNNTFVVFRRPDKNVWVFRCIGKEGDVVEIRDTKVYLNGNLLNEPYAWNEYYISAKRLSTIRGYIDNHKNPLRLLNDSSYVITLSDAELKNYHLDLRPYLSPKGQANPTIFSDFKKLNYNEDNMGPIKVPANSYFMLGDSRHDAYDSRYFGFITNDDIVSTVIN